MARPAKCRWIATHPEMTAFKPCGVPGRELEIVELRMDELEAVRLADLEGLYQEAAARHMGVSRPTFGRLIASARQKIASALLNSKMLVFKGGSVLVRGMGAFTCRDCDAEFQVAAGTGRPASCPHCKGTDIRRVAERRCCKTKGKCSARCPNCRRRADRRARKTRESTTQEEHPR